MEIKMKHGRDYSREEPAGRRGKSLRRKADGGRSVPLAEFAQNLPGIDGEGQEPLVLGQDIFNRIAIIDDDIIVGEKGFGDMAAVRTTVNQHLVTFIPYREFTAMYQMLNIHRPVSVPMPLPEKSGALEEEHEERPYLSRGAIFTPSKAMMIERAENRKK
jgi:hypothetical protein